MSNDHTVPQMYLRRFGWQRRTGSKEWFISARRVNPVEPPFLANVKKVAAVNDFYGDRVEKLLCAIEGDAAPVFDTLLEDPRGALPGPDRWSLVAEERAALAWWIGAQITRTTRQRRRLQHLAERGTSELAMSQSIRSMAGRDEHVRFMAAQIARLSWVIFDRPWGLGFSDLCLWTGDTPVVIVNGQDDENQALATTYWDVILPLDPHRFLLLPGFRAREEDPRKRRDHLLKLPGGLGAIISQTIFAAAHSHVFCHELHDSIGQLEFGGPRLRAPWEGSTDGGPSWLLEYATLNAGWTVDRKWLSEHLPPRSDPVTNEGPTV
ncbi:DUF4238 domain-containing protein [Amycolatopsis magusensis]|uniref:DUF4238 domain-containing protein n=1 Tax=Amycolatopsis magusensis TaxID=882444 RepID=UPI0037AB8563